MTANWCFYLFPTLVSPESQIFQNAIKIEGQKVDAFYTYLSISKYYKIHYGDFQDAWFKRFDYALLSIEKHTLLRRLLILQFWMLAWRNRVFLMLMTKSLEPATNISISCFFLPACKPVGFGL